VCGSAAAVAHGPLVLLVRQQGPLVLLVQQQGPLVVLVVLVQ
jgi:hypothetical protein